MFGHHDDVIHHARNIREDYMVLSLEDELWTFLSLYNKRVVDEAGTKWLDLCDCAGNLKFRGDRKILFHSAIVCV